MPTPKPALAPEQVTSELWIVRRLEGFARELLGLYSGQSTKPLMRSKDEDALRRIADAHNATVRATPPADSALVAALQGLVDLYVANNGTEAEFIKCITPKHAHSMTKQERKACEVWAAWDKALALLAAGTPSEGNDL